jgi:maltose-binding protein MalE
LVRILLDDLATEEEESPFLGGAVFAIHTPEYAPEAAAQLALVLNQQEESKNECG